MPRKILFILLHFYCFSLYAQKPNITSFTPLSGPVGTELTILGNNFSSSISNNIVFVGGSKATIISSSVNTIKIQVPPCRSTEAITVLNLESGLQGISSRCFNLTFLSSELKDFTNQSFTNSTLENINKGFWGYGNISDLNGDGKLDLAIVNSYGQITNLYKNNSSAGALNQTSLALAASFNVIPQYLFYDPKKPRFADLDGDGKLDLIIPYFQQSKIAIYKNNSSTTDLRRQTFGNEIQINVGPYPSDVCFSDLDGDGKMEIIAICGGGISILKNISTKGNLSSSSFLTNQDIAVNIYDLKSISSGDIDNDGKIDLIVGGEGASVLKNISQGSTIAFSNIKIESTLRRNNLFLTDVDNDGKLDIVAGSNQKGVFIYRNSTNSSDITFDKFFKIDTDEPVTSLDISDINGDNKPDFVCIAGKLMVIQNNIKNNVLDLYSFKSPVILKWGIDFYNSVTCGDIDGDGKQDIILVGGNEDTNLFHNKIEGKPVITSFTPNSAKEGEIITINGNNFSRTLDVNFGQVKAKSFTIVSKNQVKAVVDKGSSGYVSIANSEGIDSLSGFTYIGPPVPIVSSFSPSSASLGQKVTIKGNNFSNITSVEFGGRLASSFKVESLTEITAIVANGSSGEVVVKGKDGVGKLAGFTYIPLPTIISTPGRGKAGDIVTITGTNFLDVLSVKFGDVDVASFNVISPTTIIATLGYGETGLVNVTTIYGAATGAYSFIYDSPPPKISSFYPLKGNAGSELTMKGENFSLVNNMNFVYFGSVRAIVKSSSIDQLIVIVPHSAGYEPISLVTHNAICYSKGFFNLTFDSFNITNSTYNLSETIYDKILLNTIDIDNDGMLDLVLKLNGTAGASGGSFDYLATTSLNRNLSYSGKTSFGSRLLLGNVNKTPSEIHDVGISDIDFDGQLDIDLLGLYKGYYTISSWVPKIYFPKSNSDYKYDPYISHTFPFTQNYYDKSYIGMTLNDFDGNGRQDLFFFNKNNLDFKNGVIGDLDADGKPDIVVRNGDKIEVFKNNSTIGDIKFNTKTVFDANGQVISVAVGDFNNDEKLDLALLNNLSNNNGSLQILINKSDSQGIKFGNLLEIDIPSLTNSIGCISAGDLNGDGKIDLAIGLESKTFLLENTTQNGIINFNSKVEYPYAGNGKIKIVDIDGDAKADILLSGSSHVHFLLSSITKNIKIDDFTPKTGKMGDKIVVNGSGFLSVKKLFVGGREMKKFTVNSDSEINLEIDSLASGSIRLTDNKGFTSSILMFNYLIKPELSKKDTVIAFNNYSFYLQPIELAGYFDDDIKEFNTSQTLLVINGNIRYNYIGKEQKAYIGESGKYELNTITPFGTYTSNSVYVKFIKYSPIDNFNIAISGVSCKGMSNGAVKILNKSKANCTINLIGDNIKWSKKFDNEIVINDIPVGIYKMCLSFDGISDINKCYDIVISEPKDLAVYSVINSKDNTVDIKLSGAITYNLQLNDKVYTTKETSITLPLKSGKNILKVTTDKICQGVLESEIFINDKVIIYPNPVQDILNINIGPDKVKVAVVKIYNIEGKLLYEKILSEPSAIISLNLNDIKIVGHLFLKLIMNNNERTYKILKI